MSDRNEIAGGICRDEYKGKSEPVGDCPHNSDEACKECYMGKTVGEEVEVVAWMWRDINGDMQFNYMHPEGQALMTVAQHQRIVAAKDEAGKLLYDAAQLLIEERAQFKAVAEREWPLRRDMEAQRDTAQAVAAELRAQLAQRQIVPDWVPVSERLPEVPEGDEQEVIVCVQRAHNGNRYVFSARYLNNYPLHNDYEDEPMICTGWHDVKEHADYDGWYSQLELAEGDEIVGWMPLPAAPIGGE